MYEALHKRPIHGAPIIVASSMTALDHAAIIEGLEAAREELREGSDPGNDT